MSQVLDGVPRTLAPADGSPCASCGQVHTKCCYHRKRRGPNGELVPCGGERKRGQLNCRMHWDTPDARAAGRRRLALGAAEAELAAMGRPIVVDTAEAMLEMVYESAGNVAFLRTKVQALAPVVGPDGLAANAGSVSKTNEALRHIWVVMYDDEREKLVRWCKACRDANVDERRVEIAQAQGSQLAAVLRSSFEAFFALLREGVPWELVQREHTPGIVRRAIETTVREES